jgi:hypothetical protein
VSNNDSTVTIDIADNSCHYDYNIASFNSATSSLNSSSTMHHSLTIPKTILKNTNILVV